MTFKEIRELSGMNMSQFSKHFNIPYRTIQDWEAGKRNCPVYVLELLKYRIENEQKKEAHP